MNKAEKGKRKNAGSHWESNPGPLKEVLSLKFIPEEMSLLIYFFTCTNIMYIIFNS